MKTKTENQSNTGVNVRPVEAAEQKFGRRLDDQALDERLRFEQLLSGISGRFVNIHPDRVDPEIEESLRQTLDFFKVDRCVLIRFLPGEESWEITHSVAAENAPRVPVGVKLIVTETNPWAAKKLIVDREVLNISSLDDLPPEANVDKETWIGWGIRSNLNIPILIGEPVNHVFAINSVKSERVWPEDLIQRLRLMGEIFVNALERKRIGLEIEERLRFERLISDLSSHFVSLALDQIGDEINKWLHAITEFFDADRCTIGLFSDDAARLTSAFGYHREDAEPSPESMSRDQFPWYIEQMIMGNPVVMNRVEDLPPEAENERQLCLLKGMKSLLSVPIARGGKALGSCALVAVRTGRIWPEQIVQRFRLVAEVFANTLARKRMEEQHRENLREIEKLKQRLEKENIYLKKEVSLLAEHTGIVGQSPAMKKVLSQAERVAPTDSTVLIQGETGTGKELLARTIHSLSPRKDRPLVTVNCASLPPTLIESELFGRERGAYTGALSKMVGRFEIADGSTLFLDEIGELPLDVQGKLLRVLEEGGFERLGSTKTLHTDARIIAATNRNLGEEMKAGRFRKDLYYRLNVFPISIPPLRERREDIPPMVMAFVRNLEKRTGKEINTISKETMDALQSYSWPGNARELKNIIEHAMILSMDNTLVVHLPHSASLETDDIQNLHDVERMHIVSVLEKAEWRLGGKGGAAEVLGLKRTTLQSKMQRLGIKPPKG